ncbi:sulfate transporter [Aplochiton taeniatus]
MTAGEEEEEERSCPAAVEEEEEENQHHLPLLLERRETEEVTWRTAASRRLRKHCSCSAQRAKELLLDSVPILRWLPRYQLRDWLLGDLMSGLIVGILLVPQAIAYSLLANQDPIYGLYTSFFACIIYSFLGSSRHISVGIFGVLCLLVGQVVDRELEAAGYPSEISSENNNNNNNTAAAAAAALLASLGNGTEGAPPECDRSCYAIIVASTVTFTAGVYQVLMGLLQVGFVSVYLSDALLSGFATGSSLTILTSQLKYLLGLKLPRSQGWFTMPKTWYHLLANLRHTNLCDLITSLACLAVLVPTKEFNDRFKSKLKAPIPFELFVVIAATLASHFGRFKEEYGSGVAGYIPTGFMPPQLPAWSLIPSVALDAFSIAVVGFAITVSLSEMFAKKHGYEVSANQEMYAVGFCNILPSFFRCFATSAALTKTLVKESTGCQTQLSGLVSALVLLLVLLLVAPLFYSLQKCVLAVIIVVNLRGALQKFGDVPRMWRVNHVDATVWLVTMATSALVNTELGLVVGLLLSASCVLGRTQRAQALRLGRAGDAEVYEDPAVYRGLRTQPGVAVFRFDAPIYYANQSLFRKSLYRRLGLDPVKEKARRRKLEKKRNRKNGLGQAGLPEVARSQGETSTTQGFLSEETSDRVHSVVIDCSPVLFLDTAGVDALKEVRKDYKELGVVVLLARCSSGVLDSLQRGGYYPEKGEEEEERGTVFFFTVSDAVCHAQRLSALNGDCDTFC